MLLFLFNCPGSIQISWTSTLAYVITKTWRKRRFKVDGQGEVTDTVAKIFHIVELRWFNCECLCWALLGCINKLRWQVNGALWLLENWWCSPSCKVVWCSCHGGGSSSDGEVVYSGDGVLIIMEVVRLSVKVFGGRERMWVVVFERFAAAIFRSGGGSVIMFDYLLRRMVLTVRREYRRWL